MMFWFQEKLLSLQSSNDESFKAAFLTRNVAISLKGCAFHHFLFIMSFCRVGGQRRLPVFIVLSTGTVVFAFLS